MKHSIHPVILCGGSGTRLWPLSTPARPKQFLPLTTNRSMIEETALRFETSSVPTLSFCESLVVGSQQHADLLRSSLPKSRRILEPFGRNSAPAVAAACLAFEADALILILPADHDILDVPAFHGAISTAAEAANDGAIVTFGIEPTHPATGYGYIKANTGSARGALPVDAFVEKPDLKTAQSYLSDGSYYWNAGIFLFRADTMLESLNQFAPEILSGVKAAMANADNPQEQLLDPTAFAATPSISIDYAVMEKATNVKTVPVNMGWSDVGGYRALHELLTEPENANSLTGPVYAPHSEGLYIRSEGPAIAVNGVSNLAIVATDDEVMITPLTDDAAVKALGAEIQSNRTRLGFSDEIRARAKSWLFTAFETWAQTAWDPEHGGFVEQLSLDGTPDRSAPRRVRVQARQVYSFARAFELGWTHKGSAKALVERGLAYIDETLRHPDGGWVHVVAADGSPIDERRDLYDHAFLVLAGASAYKATENPRALKIADDAIAFIDARLKDHEFGGWIEGLPAALPRRANPHMHMLEAMLAYHDATGCSQALARAAECVRLFETRFFDPGTDIMAEFFGAEWQAETAATETVFEPGHHYEWATLLSQYDRISGHDTLSWRRRLIKRADRSGLNPKTGFAINALRENGEITNPNSRLWHQLEMFRAYMLHPGVASRAKAEDRLNRIFDTYLDPGPQGGWIDEIGPDGAPVAQAVPASMLYHAVTAFELLI